MRHHTLNELAERGRYMPTGEDLASHAYVDAMPCPGGVPESAQAAMTDDLLRALKDAEIERISAEQIQEDADDWERRFDVEEIAHQETNGKLQDAVTLLQYLADNWADHPDACHKRLTEELPDLESAT